MILRSLISASAILAFLGLSARASTVPAPIVVSPSQLFEGNDGAWSSFELRVGTPAQNVRVFVSTTLDASVVVLPEGCPAEEPKGCADRRGGEYLSNASSTWEALNLYTLPAEDNLDLSSNGSFGYETVGLSWQGSGGPTLNHTPIAGVATTNFYLGQFAVNPRPINFSDFNEPQQSYMTSLKEQNYIPSLSFGYTAGAPYRLKQVLGSLILGGYDTSRYTPNNLSFSFGSNDDRDLLVGLQTIVTNTSTGDKTLMGDGILTLIDPTVSWIWLPVSVCQAFESAFGLVYDQASQLYLVNDTTHQNLLTSNPSIAFSIGNEQSGGPIVKVTIPYAAFDLNASYPLVANTTRYFPLQRAANDTQYTLGRAFLQEAYITVDYERRNFSVQACRWDENAQGSIVPILSPNATSTAPIITSTTTPSPSSSSSNSSNGPSAGTTAGIAIGATVAILIIIALIYVFLIRTRRRNRKTPETDMVDTETSPGTDQEVSAYKDATLQGEIPKNARELQGHPDIARPELWNPDTLRSELGDQGGERPEMDSGQTELAKEAMSSPLYEMTGSDVAELHGVSSPRPKLSP